jgi:hypothetical protein
MNSDEAKLFLFFGKHLASPCLRMTVRDNDGKGLTQTLIPLFTILGEEAGCERPEKDDAYIYNLQRLGLLEVTFEKYYSDSTFYEPLKAHPRIKEMEKRVENESDAVVEFEAGQIVITSYGRDFYNACIASKGEGGVRRISTEPSKILAFTDY